MHRFLGRFVTVLTLAAATMAAPSPARAEDPHGSTFRIQWEVDLPLVGAEALVATSWLLADDLASASCAPHCDLANLPTFDRWSAGRYSKSWALASDMAVATVLVSSATWLGIDEGPLPALEDGVVVLQAVGAAAATTTVLNFLVRRPRPLLYGTDAPEAERRRGWATMSFPSGHTANAFAAVTAVFATGHARHPHSPWPWIWLGGGSLASGFVGLGRILAGHHFTSDVVTGAAIGVGCGLLVPALHERRLAPMVSADSHGVTVAIGGVL